MPSKSSPDSSNESMDPSESQSSSDMTLTKTTSPTPPTPEPGASLKSEEIESLSPRQMTRALDKFLSSIGGREALIDALEMSPLDKKQIHFLRLLYDPLRSKDSLYTIARDAGLPPLAVLDSFRHASFAKMHALVASQITEGVPAAVGDIVVKSVDAKIECPECFGEGKFDQTDEMCILCHGRGVIFRGSDLDRQKMLLEAGGVLKKGPGVAVQVNNNNQVNVPSSSAFFSKYVKASDEAAYDVSVVDIKEGEVK